MEGFTWLYIIIAILILVLVLYEIFYIMPDKCMHSCGKHFNCAPRAVLMSLIMIFIGTILIYILLPGDVIKYIVNLFLILIIVSFFTIVNHRPYCMNEKKSVEYWSLICFAILVFFYLFYTK